MESTKTAFKLFSSLPLDVVLDICSVCCKFMMSATKHVKQWLQPEDIGRLFITCKEMRVFGENEKIWMSLCRTIGVIDKDAKNTWRECYIKNCNIRWDPFFNKQMLISGTFSFCEPN